MFLLGCLAVHSVMNRVQDAVEEIERDADAHYGPPTSTGAHRNAAQATVGPVTDEPREAARRAYVSKRLTYLLIGLGFAVVSGLAGLIFGFWLLAYLGGGRLLLLLFVAFASGGMFGG